MQRVSPVVDRSKYWQVFMNVFVVGSMSALHGAAFVVGTYNYYTHPKVSPKAPSGEEEDGAVVGANRNLEWFLLVLHPLLLVFVEFHNVLPMKTGALPSCFGGTTK